MDEIKGYAEYYQNMHILDKGLRAVVLMENMADELFWDNMLQKYRPGRYMFIGHDNTLDDSLTMPGGCSECMKFKDYLTPFFFVCMDSDMNQMLGSTTLSAKNFICQTYTYSWESFCCEMGGLQGLIDIKCPRANASFDFMVFLKSYSKAVYLPLLTLLSCARRGDESFTIKKFSNCIPKQCKGSDLANNGQAIIKKIKKNFAAAIPCTIKASVNYLYEARECKSLSISAYNAYLHTRGHDIYNLLSYIGRLVFKAHRISFEKEILLQNMSSRCWEMEAIERDLKSF